MSKLVANEIKHTDGLSPVDVPVKFQQSGTGAVVRNAQDKSREFVSVRDFGAVGDGVANDTVAIQTAIDAVAAAGGGTVFFPTGDYRASRLIIKSAVECVGAGQAKTFLLCTDPNTTDANVTFGSFIRKADDGTRALYGGFSRMTIATAKSGVAAAQDANPNVIGLNLTACERFRMDDLGIAGFGYAALVFCRAEAGNEGMGFLNTTQDGNYNTVTSLHVVSCGKFNPDEAALWFKYKANSNKIYGAYFKPASLVAIAIPHGNDNLICGGTVESSKSIATFGKVGAVGASGNVVMSMRAEVLSGDSYIFETNAQNNTVLPGYQTGVAGELVVLNGLNNRFIAEHVNYFRTNQFPPVSNVSTLHNHGAMRVTSMNGDDLYPFFVKSETYDGGVRYPVARLWDSTTNLLSGKYIGKLEAENRDTTAGAAGVSAAVGFIAEGSGGQTGITFETGTGTTRTEYVRITNAGILRPATDNTQSLGTAANRWSVVFAGTGTINTSDAREKEQVRELSEAERAVAVRLKSMIRAFKFTDAVAAKGDGARIHIGVIAQEVKAAFEAEGLVAEDYAVLCLDEWEEEVIQHEAEYAYQPTDVIGEDGEPVLEKRVVREAWVEVRPAGNRYGVRYEELLAFIIAAI